MRQRISQLSPSGSELADQSHTRFDVVTSSTMAGPFLPPQAVLDGFKERPEALAAQGSFPLVVHLSRSDGGYCRR